MSSCSEEDLPPWGLVVLYLQHRRPSPLSFVWSTSSPGRFPGSIKLYWVLWKTIVRNGSSAKAISPPDLLSLDHELESLSPHLFFEQLDAKIYQSIRVSSCGRVCFSTVTDAQVPSVETSLKPNYNHFPLAHWSPSEPPKTESILPSSPGELDPRTSACFRSTVISCAHTGSLHSTVPAPRVQDPAVKF